MKAKTKRILAIVFFSAMCMAITYALLSFASAWYWVMEDDDALDISYPVAYGIAAMVLLVLYLSFKKKHGMF